MPSLGSLIGRKSSAPPPAPTRAAPTTPVPPEPVPIPDKRHPGMPDFEAWYRWPWPVKAHSAQHEEYIRLPGPPNVTLNVNGVLQRLVERGWKAATRSQQLAGATPRFAAGGHRAATPMQRPAADPVSQLRKGLGRPMANHWNHLTSFELVNAVAFRGDTRPPETIQRAGGFHPPASRVDASYCRAIAAEFYKFLNRRQNLELDGMLLEFWLQDMTDYIMNPPSPAERRLFSEYHFWRQIMDQEALHLNRHLDDSFLKGYVSTTRNIGTAMSGTTGMLGGGQTAQYGVNGFVYIVRVYNGFLLKTGVEGYKKGESEIANVGSIPWEDVVGFTRVHSNPFDGQTVDRTIYFQKYFRVTQYDAFRQALAQLSTNHMIGTMQA